MDKEQEEDDTLVSERTGGDYDSVWLKENGRNYLFFFCFTNSYEKSRIKNKLNRTSNLLAL